MHEDVHLKMNVFHKGKKRNHADENNEMWEKNP